MADLIKIDDGRPVEPDKAFFVETRFESRQRGLGEKRDRPQAHVGIVSRGLHEDDVLLPDKENLSVALDQDSADQFFFSVRTAS